MTRRATAVAVALLIAAASPASAAPGDLDPSFSDDGWDTQNVFDADCARDAAIQPDGKIVVVGGCDGGAPDTFSVMRYLPSGEPDQGFGTDGEVNVPFDTGTSIPTNEQALAVTLQPDGKVVVVGSADLNEAANNQETDNFAVARLLPSGQLDASFHANGTGANDNGRLVIDIADVDTARAVAVGADGSIYVGGTVKQIGGADDMTVVKLTPQGDLDLPYGGGDAKARELFAGAQHLRDMALLPDGSVVAAGFTGVNSSSPGNDPQGQERFLGLQRFTPTGGPEAGFGTGGLRGLDVSPGADEANGLAVDAAGRLVVAGTANGGGDIALARVLATNGADDSSFSGTARATFDTGAFEAALDLAITPSGQILIAGFSGLGPNPTNAMLLRIGDSGDPDASFGNFPSRPGYAIHDLGGSSEEIDGLALQPDGRAVLVGSTLGAGPDFLTMRLLGDPPASPAGGGSGTGGGGEQPVPFPPDGTAPNVNTLTATSAFAAASRGDAILTGRRRRVPIGATVRYGLSEPATTTFTVERATTGRRVGRRCVRATRRNRSRRKCTRYVRVRGSFTHQGAAGANSFKFSGRLRNRKLPVARYRLAAVATDAAGNRSPAKRRSFRIVRR